MGTNLVWLLVLGTAAWAGAGCGGRPPRVQPVQIDPAAAAREALAAYDADGDGALSAGELKKCPGLLKSIARVDADGDGRITAEELAGRIRTWQGHKVGLMRFSCKVTAEGRPLAGATVRLVGEKFLGDGLKPASGVTQANGVASVTISPDVLPADCQGLSGVFPGVYKVEITHPSRTIPAKYNTQTVLGQEIALDTEGLGGVVFDVSGP